MLYVDCIEFWMKDRWFRVNLETSEVLIVTEDKDYVNEIVTNLSAHGHKGVVEQVKSIVKYHHA